MNTVNSIAELLSSKPLAGIAALLVVALSYMFTMYVRLSNKYATSLEQQGRTFGTATLVMQKMNELTDELVDELNRRDTRGARRRKDRDDDRREEALVDAPKKNQAG